MSLPGLYIIWAHIFELVSRGSCDVPQYSCLRSHPAESYTLLLWVSNPLPSKAAVRLWVLVCSDPPATGTVLSTCVYQTPSLKLACSQVVEHLSSMHSTLGLITNVTLTTLPLNSRSWSNLDTFSECLCQGTLLGKFPLSPYPFLSHSVSPLGSHLYFLKQDFFQRES